LLHPTLRSFVIQLSLSFRFCPTRSSALGCGATLRVGHLPHGHDSVGILDPRLEGGMLFEYLIFWCRLGGLRGFSLCQPLNSSDTDDNGEDEPTHEPECSYVHDFSLNKISNFLGQMNPVLHKHVLKLMSFGEGPLLTIRQRPSRRMVSFFLDLRLWMKPFWGERMINRPTANSYLGGQLFVSLQPRRKLLTFSATIYTAWSS
jgi:hypothetical protein